MGLPWFSFNIKDFLADTKRLNTEAKGAYLCLMLDYYQQQSGPPDNDEVLATICELSLEAWKRHRPVIEPLFEIREGRWYREKIQAEMLVASDKHTKAVAKATAAANSRYGKTASGMPEASTKPASRKKPASSTASSKPEAPPKDIPKDAHLQTHLTLSTERVNAGAKDDATTGKAEVDLAGKDLIGDRLEQIGFDRATGAATKVQPLNPLGTVLPEDWVPDEIDQACAREYGMSDEEIRGELLMFHALNAQNGTFSRNWKATWQIFCARFKERKAAKPQRLPPRLEVNGSNPAESFRPTNENFERALALWIRSHNGWPYRALGPDPEQKGCKVPIELLKKYHIDPATGLYRKPADPALTPSEKAS